MLAIAYGISMLLMDAAGVLCLLGGCALSVMRTFRHIPGSYIVETILLGVGGGLLWARQHLP